MSTQSENLISPDAAGDLSHRTAAASRSIRSQLVAQRDSAGYWTGELSGSALSTATAISALSFFLQQSKTDDADHANATQLRNQAGNQIDTGIRWLSENQNEDGGWGDTDLSYSNISTTMLVVAAFHAAQRADEFYDSIARRTTLYRFSRWRPRAAAAVRKRQNVCSSDLGQLRDGGDRCLERGWRVSV